MSGHGPRDAAARGSERATVLGPIEGDILGAVTAVRDRFIVEAARSGGGFALVEHLMPPARWRRRSIDTAAKTSTLHPRRASRRTSTASGVRTPAR